MIFDVFLEDNIQDYFVKRVILISVAECGHGYIVTVENLKDPYLAENIEKYYCNLENAEASCKKVIQTFLEKCVKRGSYISIFRLSDGCIITAEEHTIINIADNGSAYFPELKLQGARVKANGDVDINLPSRSVMK